MPDCSTLLSLTPLPVVLFLKLTFSSASAATLRGEKLSIRGPASWLLCPSHTGQLEVRTCSALAKVLLRLTDSRSTLTDGSICSEECGAVARDIQTSAYPTDAFAGSPRGVRSRTFAHVHRTRAAALTRRGVRVYSEGGAGGCGATWRHGPERGRRRTHFERRERERHRVCRWLLGGVRGGGAGVGRAGQGPIESLVSLSFGPRAHGCHWHCQLATLLRVVRSPNID